jgi:hypothetical protein
MHFISLTGRFDRGSATGVARITTRTTSWSEAVSASSRATLGKVSVRSTRRSPQCPSTIDDEGLADHKGRGIRSQEHQGAVKLTR